MYKVYDNKDRFLRSFDSFQEAVKWCEFCRPQGDWGEHYYIEETPQK